ncbi:hypothetical protein M431DRAFT_382625 [Trichoderma harzianum CBS 226.95]|uniref:Uncharacterized protein n=1 Tax=Trichoderma harzianum CBS 226.95 TaxID=983964 RepID=A0A2T4AHV4_TRIHA|nr:hypothetical protein M431DRAFT_382625 [Trichoderma harzianum CBS 226.95]PTB56612.1 hypothetical protein M431DRAFT_382625 [Trichoderma harzianum CBS 226.95]
MDIDAAWLHVACTATRACRLLLAATPQVLGTDTASAQLCAKVTVAGLLVAVLAIRSHHLLLLTYLCWNRLALMLMLQIAQWLPVERDTAWEGAEARRAKRGGERREEGVAKHDEARPALSHVLSKMVTVSKTPAQPFQHRHRAVPGSDSSGQIVC